MEKKNPYPTDPSQQKTHVFHDFSDFLKHPGLEKLWEISTSLIKTRWVEGVFLKIAVGREFSLLKI